MYFENEENHEAELESAIPSFDRAAIDDSLKDIYELDSVVDVLCVVLTKHDVIAHYTTMEDEDTLAMLLYRALHIAKRGEIDFDSMLSEMRMAYEADIRLNAH